MAVKYTLGNEVNETYKMKFASSWIVNSVHPEKNQQQQQKKLVFFFSSSRCRMRGRNNDSVSALFDHP